MTALVYNVVVDASMDPALKVWMSFSSLSYCLIIVLTRWHARGHETARHRHWQEKSSGSGCVWIGQQTSRVKDISLNQEVSG
ncbi:hypothetical protein F2P81_023484 [Scophthalmus maximus]|uniref:Uncharacterized protein n=1 Tax=Scophthalmus maximus TaxID=52904 RepID=A0A6A4RZS7_SCOMX|nr:hypothetical protein F2P81_023484 [Scophthalmus maximus]